MLSATSDFRVFDDRLGQISIRIHQLPDALHNALQGEQGRLANKALRRLTTVPSRPSYPLRWKSARQRRAFFASNGFGQGIPTTRSYKLLKAWHVRYERTAEGGKLSMVNDEDYMEFVQGTHAQPFHIDTGWVQVEDVQDDFARETTDDVTAVWWTVSQAAVETKRR